MVPRDKVTAIDLNWDLPRVIDHAQKSGHSRLPVYEGDLDRIRGVLHIKQLVGVPDLDGARLRSLFRSPMFVSESLLIQDLLRQFKQRRLHLAIVVDDGGHTVGVVTLEDVLEQIVGLIFDETDRPPGHATAEAGVHHLEGQASLTLVEELFDVEFDEYDGVDSVGDLITRLAGQIPQPGSVIVCESVRFKVLAADDRRVIKVSAELIEMEED
jgi:CBS domain containing-hemolysin-like protein